MQLKDYAVCTTVALLAVAGCKGDSKADSDVLAQDSSLVREMQLASRDTTSQPQLQDVPTTPPPVPPHSATVQRARVAPASAPVTHSVARSATRQVANAPVREKTLPPPPTPTPVRTQIDAVMTPSGNTVEAGPASVGRSEGQVGIIAVGTSLPLQTGQRVCTNTNTVGDRITATLAEAVTGSNGVVIPAGATAVLEVTSLKRSDQAGDDMSIGLVAKSVMYEGKSYPVDGEITGAQVEKVRSQNGNDAGKVLGGAAVGAILGHVLGGRSKTKGTIIGAASGAAAGAILASETAKYDACVQSGSRVTVRLNSPMSVQAPAAP